MGVISQVAISNYAKFPQCIQGDNGPLNIIFYSDFQVSKLCSEHAQRGSSTEHSHSLQQSYMNNVQPVADLKQVQLNINRMLVRYSTVC